MPYHPFMVFIPFFLMFALGAGIGGFIENRRISDEIKKVQTIDAWYILKNCKCTKTGERTL